MSKTKYAIMMKDSDKFVFDTYDEKLWLHEVGNFKACKRFKFYKEEYIPSPAEDYDHYKIAVFTVVKR